MTEVSISYCSFIGNRVESGLLERKIHLLSQRLKEMHDDIQFIKEFFLAKQAKKERHRQKKERIRLEREEQRQAEQDRKFYEDIVTKVKERPWEFMPAPARELSPKEWELVSLLARDKTDQEIASIMKLKQNSVRPRICAAYKKLGLDSWQDLIPYYAKQQKIYSDHRRRRCRILLSWLLDPPPGFIRRPDLKLSWRRSFRQGQVFRYAGPHIPAKAFEWLQENERRVLRLMTQGMTHGAIAERLNIKESTVRYRLAQIRSIVKIRTGLNTWSDEALAAAYAKYLKSSRRQTSK